MTEEEFKKMKKDLMD
nr:hypothetical protein [Heyndrickxia coagulans]